jgi:hypothetical protein
MIRFHFQFPARTIWIQLAEMEVEVASGPAAKDEVVAPEAKVVDDSVPIEDQIQVKEVADPELCLDLTLDLSRESKSEVTCRNCS